MLLTVFLKPDVSVEEVYAALSREAKAAVDAARAHRAKLSSVAAFEFVTASMCADAAEKLGIKVIRRVDGMMAVGMLDIPALDGKVMMPPKSKHTLQELLMCDAPATVRAVCTPACQNAPCN